MDPLRSGQERIRKHPPGPLGTLRRLLAIMLGLLLAVTFIWVLSLIIRAPKLQDLEQEWVATFGFDPLHASAPRVANRDAQEIETMAAALGIEIAPRDLPDRARPAEESAARFEEVRPRLQAFFNALMGSESSSLEIEPELVTFLAQHHGSLERAAELLATQQPLWDLDLRNGEFLNLPQLPGHKHLHDLFLLLAAQGANQARDADSRRWLQASQTLRRSLSDDIPLLYQIIFQTELRHELGLLRHFDTLPEGARGEYEALLESRALDRAIVQAFRFETWMLLQYARTGTLSDEQKEENPFYVRWSIDLLTRYGVRHEHQAMEEMIRLVEAKSLTEYDHEAVFEGGMSQIPKWSYIARMVTPDLSDVFVRTARTELDIEMTLRVAEAREKLRHTGCQSFESRQPSVIEGVDWIYSCGTESLRIEPSHTLYQGHAAPLLPGINLLLPSSS